MTKEYLKDMEALADYLIEISDQGLGVAVVLNDRQTESLFETLLFNPDVHCGTIDYISGFCNDECRQYYVGLVNDGRSNIVDILPVRVDHNASGPITNACVDILVFLDEIDSCILDSNDDGTVQVRVVTFKAGEEDDCHTRYVFNYHVDQDEDDVEEYTTCECWSGPDIHINLYLDADNIDDEIYEAVSFVIDQLKDYFNQ